MSLALPLLRPLDALRSALLRRATPVLGPLYANRQRRVLWLGASSVMLALATTLGAPVAMLAFGPLVLGIPHLLADVRYLVIRPKAHHELGLWFAAPMIIATSLGELPAVGFAASVVVAAYTPANFWRRVVVGVMALGLTLAAKQWPYELQLGLLHVHNLVAVALWWFWRPRPKSHLVIPALIAAGSALILWRGEAIVASWWAPATATSFGEFIEQTVPTIDATLAARVVLLFAFLQSVHYALWLRLIPDDDRERVAPRTFKASFIALTNDLSTPLVTVAAVGVVGLIAWAVFDAGAARSGYLRVAAFHGYLELAMATRWLVKGAP